jgi:predicted MFS family arabinose efflux permease
VSETPRLPGRFDLAGAVTSTAGVAALVYGFIRAAGSGWGDHLGLASFGLAVALLTAFIATERRVAQPITPLRLFADVTRSASYVARLLVVAGMMGMFFFVTQLVQDVLGFSPLTAGVAFLPLTVTLFGVSRLAPRLLPLFGGKPLMIIGMIPMIIGMALLWRVSPATAYWTGVFPAMALFGLGGGLAFVPLTQASLTGVRPEDSGAASSMVNVMQQVGGALGLAVLVAVFGTASRAAIASHPAGLTATATRHYVLTHGMSAAFGLAALFDLATLLLVVFLFRGAPRPAPVLATAPPVRAEVRVPDMEDMA